MTRQWRSDSLLACNQLDQAILCRGSAVARKARDQIDQLQVGKFKQLARKPIWRSWRQEVAGKSRAGAVLSSHALPRGTFWEGESFWWCWRRTRSPTRSPICLLRRSAGLLSRVQLEIWAFVTPDVTPSTFSLHSASLNIPHKSLILKMERVKGIEPSSSAWKAVALPLSYTRARWQ